MGAGYKNWGYKNVWGYKNSDPELPEVVVNGTIPQSIMDWLMWQWYWNQYDAQNIPPPPPYDGAGAGGGGGGGGGGSTSPPPPAPPQQNNVPQGEAELGCINQMFP